MDLGYMDIRTQEADQTFVPGTPRDKLMTADECKEHYKISRPLQCTTNDARDDHKQIDKIYNMISRNKFLKRYTRGLVMQALKSLANTELYVSSGSNREDKNLGKVLDLRFLSSSSDGVAYDKIILSKKAILNNKRDIINEAAKAILSTKYSSPKTVLTGETYAEKSSMWEAIEIGNNPDNEISIYDPTFLDEMDKKLIQCGGVDIDAADYCMSVIQMDLDDAFRKQHFRRLGLLGIEDMDINQIHIPLNLDDNRKQFIANHMNMIKYLTQNIKEFDNSPVTATYSYPSDFKTSDSFWPAQSELQYRDGHSLRTVSLIK